MKKFMMVASSLLALLAGGTGEAEAAPCRSFDRQFVQNGYVSYQSGTECLNRWGDWETVAVNDNYYTPYYSPPVQYVTVREPIYTPGISLNLGFLDINRRDYGGYGGSHRNYGRAWHDNDNRGNNRGHNGRDGGNHGRH